MERGFKIILPALGVAVVIAVALLLHHELRQYDYATVMRSLREVPHRQIALALGLTTLSYFLLILYDVLALRQLARSPGFWRTALASFTAYVLSYNIGLSVISGAAVRLRLYSAWNFTRGEIGRLVTFTTVTFWTGLFAASGALLLLGRPQLWPGAPAWITHLRLIGAALVAVVMGYLVLCAMRRRPLVIRGWQVPLPRWPVASLQVALGAIDIVVAGLVGWVLMPAGWPWESYLAVYLGGMTVGLI